ncbi:MAG: Xaa-Pro peptidase family protein [Candidatus Omnitrophota bacterium]
MNARVKKIISGLKQEGLEGLVVSSPANISYLAEIRSRDSYLVLSKKECVYLADLRYTEELKSKLRGFSLHKITASPLNAIAGVLKDLGVRRVGFESDHLSFFQCRRLKSGCPQNTKLIPTRGLVEQLREVKDAGEIAKIRKATSIASEALRHIRRFIVSGKREIEIAAELEHFIRYRGGYSASFEIIVASGPNSAFPHHQTSRRRLGRNEPVLIDMGVDYAGYKSDLTRVFFLGKINPLAKKIYGIVKEAAGRAFKKAKRTGIINQIDGAARQYITENGYGGFFGHNLGHGIGLEIHENPTISPRNNNRLKAGMVFTIEPAIYLPQKFGIRLEDIVLVTEKGAQLLSGALDK